MNILEDLDNQHSLEVYLGGLKALDLVEMLVNKVSKEGLVCVEKLGQSTARIYFKNFVDINSLLESPVVIKNRELHFLRVGEKTKTVFVKGLPIFVSEKTIYEVMKTYGKVRSIGLERYAGYKPVCTGTRILRIKLEKPIPNFVRFEKFVAIIVYKNQVQLCRRCGSKDHLAKQCNTRREDFQEGFPIHTRPVTPRNGGKAKPLVNRKHVEVQTLSNSPMGNLNPSKQKPVLKSNNVSMAALEEKLKGQKIGVNQNTEANSPPQVEVPVVPVEKLQQKGKKGILKVTSDARESSVALDVSASASPKISEVASDSAVPNVIEVNESATNKKKKKKKKKKSHKNVASDQQ